MKGIPFLEVFSITLSKYFLTYQQQTKTTANNSKQIYEEESGRNIFFSNNIDANTSVNQGSKIHIYASIIVYTSSNAKVKEHYAR